MMAASFELLMTPSDFSPKYSFFITISSSNFLRASRYFFYNTFVSIFSSYLILELEGLFLKSLDLHLDIGRTHHHFRIINL